VEHLPIAFAFRNGKVLGTAKTRWTSLLYSALLVIGQSVGLKVE
jgi:hypothetical protein